MRRTLFDDDHAAFRSSVRAFLDREVRPSWDDYIVNKQFPREMWKAMGAQGLLGLEVPEEYGGAAAGDYRYNAVLQEELCRLSMSLGSCHSIHADIVAPYLVKLTTEEQRERWLPGFVTGDILCAIGMTEPSGGSDLAALKTTAVRDGDAWILNGSKTFITNGYSADLVVVAARTDPDARRGHGISLFGVESTMPGFTRGRKLDKVGMDESDTAELFFENIRVPSANLIGEVNKGFGHMMSWLPQERLSNAIGCLAHVCAILEETLVYVRERTAFGQPVGAFQHNKFRLAEAVTRLEVTQSFLDQAIEAHAVGALTPVDAAKAKWWASEVQNDVLDLCVQLHGGYGFMNEYRVGRAWRDARITKIWAGTNEIMKELIGRDLGL